MADYDLYGIDVESIEQARAVIEKALSIVLVERDSSYHRGPYFSIGEIGSENFEVKANIDPFEDVPVEEQFAQHRFLLYVNNTSRSAALSASLLSGGSQVSLLRRETFT